MASSARNRGSRRAARLGLAAFMLLAAFDASYAGAQQDPLASWNEGAAKNAITDFVGRVATAGSPDFVPVSERIAVFDNDGTLWSERPIYFQLQFALDRTKLLAPQHPEWKDEQPLKALIEGDHNALLGRGAKGLLQLMAASHAGITTEQFSDVVSDWLETARHPRFNRPYSDLVYQPMLELLAYLRDHGFKTFIVSGGGVEFMRAFAERTYGIPPERIVGSSGATQFKVGPDGKPILLKLRKVEFIDDGAGKPVGINRFIGRRPILAFGNSDGDRQMLQWTAAGGGLRFVGLVHHTDAEREWAYDRTSHIGKLDKALDDATAHGWLVVDMKQDWRTVFAFEQ